MTFRTITCYWSLFSTLSMFLFGSIYFFYFILFVFCCGIKHLFQCVICWCYCFFFPVEHIFLFIRLLLFYIFHYIFFLLSFFLFEHLSSLNLLENRKHRHRSFVVDVGCFQPTRMGSRFVGEFILLWKNLNFFV